MRATEWTAAAAAAVEEGLSSRRVCALSPLQRYMLVTRYRPAPAAPAESQPQLQQRRRLPDVPDVDAGTRGPWPPREPPYRRRHAGHEHRGRQATTWAAVTQPDDATSAAGSLVGQGPECWAWGSACCAGRRRRRRWYGSTIRTLSERNARCAATAPTDAATARNYAGTRWVPGGSRAACEAGC